MRSASMPVSDAIADKAVATAAKSAFKRYKAGARLVDPSNER